MVRRRGRERGKEVENCSKRGREGKEADVY